MTAIRRFAAILAADVAGYSRLIGADDAGTLQAFNTRQAELFEPTIATHNGRLVKTTGDGFLVEFSSVVDAPTPGDRSANAYGARAIREGLAGSTVLDNLSARKGCRCWPRLIRGARRGREQLEPKDRNVNSKAFAVAQG
jgi:class 3 adenylate cyclase